MKLTNLGAMLVGIFVVGCGESSTITPGAGGSVTVGGAQASGGSSSAGGAGATGGTLAAGAGTGGVTAATGGMGDGGNSPTTGGKSSAGGSAAGGQATGGKSSAGGSAAGGQATGGQSAAGGSAAGGSAAGGQATGGKTTAGGSNTGGTSSASGGNGGSQPTGGKSSAGGGNGGSQPTGGQANGGDTSAGGSAPQSSGCGKTSTITSSQYNNGNPISITVNGSQRRYILNVPTNYDNSKPYKFVLAIHALNSNDKSVYSEKYYGLLPLSNNNVIFAAPNGVNGSTPCSGTGVGDSNCGWPSGNNNIQLMDAVVKQVTDNFCVDMNNIYATGWSYGASMSYEVGCQRPLGGPTSTATWGVRAIALYAVRQMSGNCNPSTSYPVAMYLSHGTHDSVLDYDTGISLAQKWSTADGCTWQAPTKVTSGNHVCAKMAGCKAGYPVEVCSFNGDHTAYPDNGTESSSWGPQEVWTFLSQF